MRSTHETLILIINIYHIDIDPQSFFFFFLRNNDPQSWKLSLKKKIFAELNDNNEVKNEKYNIDYIKKTRLIFVLDT